jgi:hypothetical protein
MVDQMQEQEQGLLLMQRSDTYAPHPTDVDAFLFGVYEFHATQGLAGLIGDHAVSVLTHTFVLTLFGLVLGVDLSALMRVETSVGLSTLLNTTALDRGYIVLCLAYVAYRLFVVCKRMPMWWRIHKYYRDTLCVPDTEEVTWPQVVKRMLGTDRRLLANVHAPTPLDVAARVLRRENYMVAMIRNPSMRRILTGDNDDHSGARTLSAPALFHIWWVVLVPAFANPWELKVSGGHLAQRARAFAIANAALLPLTLLLLVFYCVLQAAERGVCLRKSRGNNNNNNPTEGSTRTWTTHALWTNRHYNEYPQDAQSRMRRAAQSATGYLALFPDRMLTRHMVGVRFVSATLLGCISLIGLLNDDALTEVHVAERNLLWWGACWTGVFTVATSLLPTTLVLQPEKLSAAFERLSVDLRTIDSGGGDTHADTRAIVGSLWTPVPLDWIHCFVGAVRMPWLLWCWSLDAEEIATFLIANTARTAAGDVCAGSITLDRDVGSKF